MRSNVITHGEKRKKRVMIGFSSDTKHKLYSSPCNFPATARGSTPAGHAASHFERSPFNTSVNLSGKTEDPYRAFRTRVLCGNNAAGASPPATVTLSF
eukprot:7801325-Pyramimonas_sp.AAC.1